MGFPFFVWDTGRDPIPKSRIGIPTKILHEKIPGFIWIKETQQNSLLRKHLGLKIVVFQKLKAGTNWQRRNWPE